mmetsp:Transcript_3408/g.11749  ORF Transcript_3408/g.11749 Transcript_3408/m.11749 type:complete len:92 (+) Transcript_3408:2139-2414(+)
MVVLGQRDGRAADDHQQDDGSVGLESNHNCHYLLLLQLGLTQHFHAVFFAVAPPKFTAVSSSTTSSSFYASFSLISQCMFVVLSSPRNFFY